MNLLHYIYTEVKNRRLPKKDAIELIRQIQTQITSNQPNLLHPLLHQNTSTLYEQRFSSTFTGQEPFMADYIIKGQRILPGTAYLEMVRAAIELATDALAPEFLEGRTVIRLKNMVWAQPIIIHDKPVSVHIRLFPEDNGEIAFEIYSEPDLDSYTNKQKELLVYCQGSAQLRTVTEIPTIDINTLQAGLSQKNLLSSQCYEAFKSLEVNYGLGYQCFDNVYVGANQVLAKLSLPPSSSGAIGQFTLHPGLVNLALQTSFSLMESMGIPKPFLPFSLSEIEFFNHCAFPTLALVRLNGGAKTEDKIQKFDIDLCDEQGNVCVQLKEFSVYMFEGDGSSYSTGDLKFSVKDESALGSLLFEPIWEEKTVTEGFALANYACHHVILCEPGDISRENIEAQMNKVMSGCRCLSLEYNQGDIARRFEIYAAQVFEEIQRILKGKPKENILIQIIVFTRNEQQLFSGLSGLLKTAHIENPKIIGQLIEIEPNVDVEGIIKILKENSQCPIDRHVRYQGGKRWVAGWREIEANREKTCIPWKDKGIYLITGGTGGLGLIFSKEIVQKVKDATLILTGRSPLDERKQTQLRKLEVSGARIIYQQVDVTQKEIITDLIQWIQNDIGNLNGIIHSAGVIRDNYILNKNKEEFQEVLGPKVTGIINLDQASKDLNLEFFILFSSIAGSFGNLGQADYSTANAFLNSFANYRNSLVAAKQRQGYTIAINWPLWKEGGMRVDEATEKTLMQNMGMIAMRTQTGVQAFYQSFLSGKAQVLVMEGAPALMRQKIFSTMIPSSGTPFKESSIPEVDPVTLKERTIHQLKVLFGEVAKLDIGKIDISEPFESYGIDSIMINLLNQKLDCIFGELSKTLFYEYKNLKDLAEYFVTDHAQGCMDWTGLKEQVSSKPEVYPALPEVSTTLVRFEDELPVLISLEAKRKGKRGFAAITPKREPIAIIGMSGRYPQAKTLKEYWQNLEQGKDCITEIPAERWSLDGFFHPDQKEAVAQGKSYSKWGGFVEGFAEFDPLFFNISPREALNMDPQERLFIESCWEVLEDAGYTKEQLATQYHHRVGVFVGITKTGFDLYGPDLWKKGEESFPHTSFGSVANRISYLLDLQGPSMPIDTMCSSSLTAIHEACEHLNRGECEMAIAGGVNLYLHPSSYVYLCSQQMLSKDGQCKSFGKGGNGFVPGEGVGVVLLKPLSRAIADQDHIYAVIRGTSINHGGKTNGYTVPNPNAQGEVVKSALDKAGINARTISYIEAHGTGTELGDPIEITGLTQAFRKDTDDTQFCAIGSAKSNIGHLEAAAGIAGITKIVLQMNHGKLVPSLHAKELNPNINFAKTPFVVQQELVEWKRPVINGQEIPRRAGVSSFGAGGSNAHVVIEEYISNQERPQIIINTMNQAIIVLSAKNGERLKEQARRLLAAIQEQQFSDADLADIAYTLQVGREAMEERLAMIVGSIKELAEKLKGFIEDRKGIEDLYRGQVKQNKEMLTVLTADKEMLETIEKWIQHGKYKQLVDLWVRGFNFDWNRLYGDTKPYRISLPTYPFAGERYWLPEKEVEAGNLITSPAVVTSFIHPLLHQNTSDFSEQRFSSTFTGQEFFLADHVVKGQRVLPGVAYLEMARAAMMAAAGHLEKDKCVIKLKNVVWARPLVVSDHPVLTHISLFPEESGEIAYEIYSKSEARDAEPVIHSQGNAVLSPVTKAPTLELGALKAQCNQQIISSGQCYEAFGKMGFNYGPGHQGINKIYIGSNQILAELSLPISVYDTENQFVLHPSLMDSALQASIGLILKPSDWNNGNIPNSPALPFALQELEIFGDCVRSMWALIRYSNIDQAPDTTHMDMRVQKLDIDLCDNHGNVCVRIKGFASRVLEGEISANHDFRALHPMNTSILKSLLLKPIWREQTITGNAATHIYNQHLVILCEPENISPESFNFQINGAASVTRYLILQSKLKNIEDRYQTYAVQVLEELQKILNDKPKDNVLIQMVTFAGPEQKLFVGLFGLLKSTELENPKLITQLIEVDDVSCPEDLKEKLQENSQILDKRIRYQDGKRWVADWNEVVGIKEDELTIPWKDRGIYMITGGAGGLGLIFAREISRRVKHVSLILTGRSKLNEEKQAKLEELRRSGARVDYRQVDVTQKKAVMELIQSIQRDYGSLNGIIHSAGIIRDNFIIKKTKEELQDVLAPKVTGLVNLDQASKNLALDFFLLFSSVAGSLGNIGQADYSAANAFMDAYAGYRNFLAASGERHGRTLAINWPLWKEGGMHVTAETEAMMAENMGMIAMQTATGIQALYQSFASGQEQVMVVEGDLALIRRKLLLQTNDTPIQPESNSTLSETGGLLEKVKAVLTHIVSQLLNVDSSDIDAKSEFSEYGLDQYMLSEFVNRLNQEFDLELIPSIFNEYSTLNTFAEYLVSEYQNLFAKRFGITVCESASTIEENEKVAAVTEDLLQEKTVNFIKKLLSSVIKLPVERIEADAPMEEYGIDSIMVMQLTNQLEKSFGSLPKTLFFEYQNIQELTGYFLAFYRERLINILGIEEKTALVSDDFKDSIKVMEPVELINSRKRSRFTSVHVEIPEEKVTRALDIAIIGVAGRYPGARNVQEFWKNLRDGKDCITEIPKDRWDHSLYFDEDKNKPGKTYSKWGGFLDDVDKFDPLFFNISPREAEMMDPQERLFLECVYETLEDAGYTREALRSYQGLGLEGNVGVFVGVMYEEYQLYGAQAQILGWPVALYGNPASIANRVSYFCNFHGPSMAIDTMCSSSLTAIHLACQSLQRGDCELAIAGGVNVSIHPNKYLMLGQGKFVSSKGRCESFGEGGDGYVPSEGVGAVLLKPLSKAISDGDQIYGIIKGTAVNHGGKTNGYTVPNPNAQAWVIGHAIKVAGINPRAISYIEAHGTGTSLGDPIEIAGLNKAFQEYTRDKQFCAIGSAKSNIGHCESAAGIAGVTKVLLQLKNRQLAPSLHSKTLNPNIDFSNTPFVVQQELTEWKRPVVEIDGSVREYPRIAGISSFGAGGANAHVIIEEYIAKVQEPQITITSRNTTATRAIIVLSAKNEERLKEQAQRLLVAIQEQQFSNLNLVDIAYTLQVGREPMEERLALIVSSIKELEEKLKGFITGQENISDLFRGQVKRNQETLAVFMADEDLQKAIDAWISKGKYAKLLDLWVKGLVFDWNKLYGQIRPRRISLPTYPFARERYWAPDSKKQEAGSVLLQKNNEFDDTFYDQLMDEIINKTISIDTAVRRIKNHQYNKDSLVRRKIL